MDKILLFIPMYNCEKQITRVLGQLTDEVCKYLSELIIVNNRSTDNGEEAVIKYLSEHKLPLKASLLRNDENYGLGGSHKVAFQYAIKNGFDYVIVLHGDDQGRIMDFIPLMQSGEYKKYDCCLGARFMKGSVLSGYSNFRKFGNRIFNIFFSIAVRKKIYDLGSGLNMYAVTSLKTRYYHKYPDNLTFNCYMLFALNAYKFNHKFYPISWSESDQISNVKMTKQAWDTFKMVVFYVFRGKSFLEKEARICKIEDYNAKKIFDNWEY